MKNVYSTMYRFAINILFSSIFISANAQPGGNLHVSFLLDDDMKSGYTLCSRFERNPESPQVSLPDSSREVSFYNSKYDNDKKLILYRDSEMMTIYIYDLVGFISNESVNLGKIEFANGAFIVNAKSDFDLFSDETINWENCKLHEMDSGYYYQLVYSGNDLLSSALVYNEEMEPVREVHYDRNGRIVFELNHEPQFQRYYYPGASSKSVKSVTSFYERIELDSVGVVTNRVVFDRSCLTSPGGAGYQQRQHIGKHYLEILSSLPVMLLDPSLNPLRIHDEFVCSLVISRPPYSIQLSRVGPFPQDTIDSNEFISYHERIELKVTFSSGAFEIGKPIVLESQVGSDVRFDIYLVESKNSYDNSWQREVFIPLQLLLDKTYQIHFPLQDPNGVIPSDGFVQAPQWILQGYNDSQNDLRPAIVIHGCLSRD